MFNWMLYVIVVSLLLGLAALAAERAGRLRRASTRWYWLAAILASLLVPAVIASVSIELPKIVGTRVAEKALVLRESTSIPLEPQLWLGLTGQEAYVSPGVDTWIQRAWFTVSLLMLAVLALHGLQLFRRKRGWHSTELEGRAVLVAEDVGPAVVGFLRPRIVIPAWLTKADRRRQLEVIAHEQAHLAAGDPQLFTMALCLLVFMPWNLPLWWQLKRLRKAIEVDCDARVLDAGHDVSSYGETLISVGERQSAFIGAVAAMTESRSFLEERIAIMMKKPVRWWQIPATALSCLSIALVAAAAQIIPPNSQGDAPPKKMELSDATLDLYTGTYKLTDQLVFSVTRKGNQLLSRITGQSDVEIYARSRTSFFNTPLGVELDFASDGTAPATALELRQHGRTANMPRIDAATAATIESSMVTRIQKNVPSPGTEAAIRDIIQRREADQELDYSVMSPQLAEAVRQQAPQAKASFEMLGRMKSIEFQGVGAQGMDAYLVKFEKGAIIYRIAMQDGIITGMLIQTL